MDASALCCMNSKCKSPVLPTVQLFWALRFEHFISLHGKKKHILFSFVSINSSPITDVPKNKVKEDWFGSHLRGGLEVQVGLFGPIMIQGWHLLSKSLIYNRGAAKKFAKYGVND